MLSVTVYVLCVVVCVVACETVECVAVCDRVVCRTPPFLCCMDLGSST